MMAKYNWPQTGYALFPSLVSLFAASNPQTAGLSSLIINIEQGKSIKTSLEDIRAQVCGLMLVLVLCQVNECD